MRAERVDAVVVMHADGDERGERHGRTADALLMLRAEGAKVGLCRWSVFGRVPRCTLGGGSGGGTVLRLLGVLKAQKRVDGDLIDLAQLDELWKLRLRRAALPFGNGLTRNAELLGKLLLRHTARAAQFV